MPIKSTTVYTKERFLNYNKYIMSSYKILTIVMVICTLFIIGLNIVEYVYGISDPELIETMFTIILFDLIYIGAVFILPRFVVNKHFNVNATNIYTFHEDSFTIDSNTAHSTENATIKYSIIKKAVKNGTDLYMFIDRFHAYIVDLAELNEDEISNLKGIITNNVPEKKIKWK